MRCLPGGLWPPGFFVPSPLSHAGLQKIFIKRFSFEKDKLSDIGKRYLPPRVSG